ncbi:MAG: hypothetical protein KDK78_04935, partial [Chlamydiia bacterium]|nr:hypothetical protein [Chlamydiia bacterium]
MMDLSSIRAANQLDPQQWGQCNALGVTPFHQLAERADGAPALRMLGAALPNLLSVRDSKNRTAFDAALERGCTEALQALLDVGYELHPFDERDPLHWRLLGLSVRDQNLALLRHTLQLSRAEKNMNPILWETHDTEHGWVFRHRLSGYSLLHAAIDAESPEGVEALLTLGLSVDARDFHQDTPLHVLCQRCLSRGTTRLRRKLLELLVGA